MSDEEGEAIEVPEKTEKLESESPLVSDLAQEVIEGKWGLEQEYRKNLSEAGYDPNLVEAEVTRRLNK